MTNNIEMRNAQIEGTMLGFEDHGLPTAMLYLKYSGSGQGAGGYHLGLKGEHIGTWVLGILRTVGVHQWEQLKGKHIRVAADYGKVYALGNIMEDKWVLFSDMTPEPRPHAEIE